MIKIYNKSTLTAQKSNNDDKELKKSESVKIAVIYTSKIFLSTNQKMYKKNSAVLVLLGNNWIFTLKFYNIWKLFIFFSEKSSFEDR